MIPYFDTIYLFIFCKRNPIFCKRNPFFLFRDHEFEQLYQQWEENEEPIPVDELPNWDPRKPKPFLDPEKFHNPQDYIKASKKGQMGLLFVQINGFPTRKEVEEITGIWQTGLMNNHIHSDRYIIEDRSVLFSVQVLLNYVHSYSSIISFIFY